MTIPMRFLISLVIIVSLTGCQYDRSFMQMNSDSGSPFLGLQLRVDASDLRTDDASEEERVQIASSSESRSSEWQSSESRSFVRGPFLLTGGDGQNAARLIPTSRVAESDSSVRYSLPEQVTLDGTQQAAEVESIFRRMSAF